MTAPRARRSVRSRQVAKPPWRRWLLVVLLASGAIGLLVWVAGGPTKDKGRKSKRIGERSELVRPPRKPRLRLAGRVQTAAGQPVKGATVFVLPKTRRGGVRDDLVHEVTDGDGRWSLRARSAFGCWIGVVAKGYLHAYLDGDKVDPAVQMFHLLEPAPELTVTLLDEAGAPIEGKGVQLDPWPPTGTWFLPGPGSRQGERWGVSDFEGELTFRVGSRGPVVLVPHVEGQHAMPPRSWLPQASGAVELRLHPNCSLNLEVKARDGGAAFNDLLTVDFHDTATGRFAFSFTESPGTDGVLRIERRIRPGTYDLHVQAEGWTGALLSSVGLPGNGEGGDTRMAATLARAAAEGTLTLRLTAGPGALQVRRSGAVRRAPLSFILRDEPGWRKLGWVQGVPESWSPVSKTLVLKQAPGRYHLLVADVVRGCAVLVRGLVVEPGGAIEKALTLERGLAAAPTELRLRDGRAQRIRVEAADGLRLPVYGHTRDRAVRIRSEYDLLARAGEGRDVLVGPYPVAAVKVTVQTWEGAVRTASYGP